MNKTTLYMESNPGSSKLYLVKVWIKT